MKGSLSLRCSRMQCKDKPLCLPNALVHPAGGPPQDSGLIPFDCNTVAGSTGQRFVGYSV